MIIGAYANSFHLDRVEIGARNWKWWEIEQSLKAGNKLVAVKIDPSYDSPDPIFGRAAAWARSFLSS